MVDLFGEEIPYNGGSKRRDWTGNKKGVYSVIGATNHSLNERAENDFYATPPFAVEELLKLEEFSTNIWEPACGFGHISRVFEEHGHNVTSTDLIDRGYGKGGMDFLKSEAANMDCDIVTNPPYKYAQEFVEKALSVVAAKHKVAMFLKLTFLEGKNRRRMFELYPPKVVYVSTSRLACAKNGTEWIPSCICYAWFVWEKGFKGEPVIRWWN